MFFSEMSLRYISISIIFSISNLAWKNVFQLLIAIDIFTTMGKDKKKGVNGNVFKVAGAKSLKKTKAKAVNLGLKNVSSNNLLVFISLICQSNN